MSDKSKPLTAEELEVLRELEAKATNVPWERVYRSNTDLQMTFVGIKRRSDFVEFGTTGFNNNNEDAALIEAMRNALPRLLSMLQPPTDAAVREAVEYYCDKYMGGVSEADLHLGTLLRAVQAPRLTEERLEVLKEVAWVLHNEGLGNTLVRLNAAFPGV